MKKCIYIIIVIILLLVLSILFYNLSILFNIERYSKSIIIAMLIIIGGYNLGQRWWDYVYVQKKHSNKWIDKLTKIKK